MIASAQSQHAAMLLSRDAPDRLVLMMDDVDYYNSERLKLEGETENKGVCTKEWERHDSRGTHG